MEAMELIKLLTEPQVIESLTFLIFNSFDLYHEVQALKQGHTPCPAGSSHPAEVPFSNGRTGGALETV